MWPKVVRFVLWIAGIVVMVALVSKGGTDTVRTDPVLWAAVVGVVLLMIGPPDDDP